MIRIDLILDKLKLKNIIYSKYENHSDHEYAVILRNSGLTDLSNSHVINVATAEELRLSQISLSGALFLIGNDVSIDSLGSVETVLFDSNVSPYELIALVNEIMSEYERYKEYIVKLNAFLQKGADLIEIFDLFSQYYDNPVSFGDLGGNILLTGNIRQDFTEWDETIRFWIEKGYIPYEFSKKHGNLIGSNKVKESSEPVIMDSGYASRYRRLSYRTCYYNGAYNNFFAIVEVYNTYRLFDKDVLVYTADLVSVNMLSQLQKHIEIPRNQIFKKIISGALSDYQSITDRLQSCNIGLTNYCMVIVIRFDKAQTSERDKQISTHKAYFKNMLNYSVPFIMNFAQENDIILLLQAKTAEDMNERFESLQGHFNQSIILVACSNIYSDILETHGRYHEAEQAINIGPKIEPDKRIFFFQNIYLEILAYFAGEKTNLKSFIVDGLLELKQYDTEKNTEYYNTLYEYILCGKNLNELSKKLMIHRNTAVYRINKVKDLISGIDFDNVNDLFRLYFSFKCVRVLEATSIHNPDPIGKITS
jgi:purine catabolism regulator